MTITTPPAGWYLGQLAITVLVLWFLWRNVDGPEILRILSAAQPLWLAAAVLVLLCQTALSGLRWKITAAQLGQSLALPHAIREYFMSQVVNQALPGAVVGDAARAVRARAQAGLAVSSQAVIFERLAGQIAMFITLACAFGVTWGLSGGLDWPTAFAGPIGLGLIIGTLILAALIIGSIRPALFGPRMQPFYTALMTRQVLPAQITLGAAITLCNLCAFALCAAAVGVALTPAAIFAVVPVILFSMLIPFTVSGWGVREGAAAVLLPLAGTTAPEAVAASVMFGCALLLAVLPGLITIGVR
jgi:uncharacterized membrane protein YbhN (UPF0104 family)